MADNGKHVLIIGAGITGLLIAQGLKKSNIKYTIFDSEPSATSYQRRDWGMSVHWSKALLEKLLPSDLWHRLPEVQVDPSFDAAAEYSIPFYNAKTGELLKSAPTPHAIRASRRKMREFCAQGIDVVYGKKLVGVEFSSSSDTVEATFSDSTTVTGAILIGADGHRSKTREILLGKERAAVQSIPGGIQLISGTNIRYDDAEKALFVRQLHPINWAAFHPDFPICTWMAMADVPDPKRPETWVFQLMPSWTGPHDPTQTDAQRLAFLKEKAVHFAEPWKSAFLWIPDGTPFPASDMTCWVTVAWDNRGGRGTLAGDAAHAMPPHRGQGLNHSIQDAVNLVEAIQSVFRAEDKAKETSNSAPTLSEAISAYDAELLKRGSDEVNTSVQSAILTHDYEKIMQAPVMRQGYVRTELK